MGVWDENQFLEIHVVYVGNHELTLETVCDDWFVRDAMIFTKRDFLGYRDL